VEPGNVESLAQALTRLLVDDALRTRMGKALQELASGKLSWDSIAKETVKLYEMLKK
jgi:glycosyltransferase involved in cell wall biosynthesis